MDSNDKRSAMERIMFKVTLSYPRVLKLVQRLWLVIAVLITVSVLCVIFTWYNNASSKFFIRGIRTQLLEARKEERVLTWLVNDPKKQFESLRHYENIHFSKDIKHSLKIRKNYTVNALNEFQNVVTVIIFATSINPSCVTNQIHSIRKHLSYIKIKVISNVDISHVSDDNTHVTIWRYATEGEALNTMILSVRTEYFLYISNGAELPVFYSKESAWWMLDALQRLPELDIVGASIRGDPHTRWERTIPCYRLQACKWIISQSYQYKYSVDDLYVCEETTTVFMAKRTILFTVGDFDKSLPSLVTTDFFYRAKSYGTVVGVRPRVVFNIPSICSHPKLQKDAVLEQHKPFLNKHDLLEFRSVSGDVTLLPNHKLPLSNYQWMVKATHPLQVKGAYGSVGVNEALYEMLIHIDKFFKQRKTTYIVAWGAVFGSLKMRGLLPYDVSIDLDLFYDAPWKSTYEAFLQYTRVHCPHYSTGNVVWGNSEIIIFDRKNLIVTSMICLQGDPSFPRTPEQLIMVPIGGRFYTANRDALRVNRDYYGLDYLRMKGHDSEDILCSVPGHHACLPKAFARGGGQWSDFNCQL